MTKNDEKSVSLIGLSISKSDSEYVTYPTKSLSHNRIREGKGRVWYSFTSKYKRFKKIEIERALNLGKVVDVIYEKSKVPKQIAGKILVNAYADLKPKEFVVKIRGDEVAFEPIEPGRDEIRKLVIQKAGIIKKRKKKLAKPKRKAAISTPKTFV